MTRDELEWAFAAWSDGRPDIERRLLDAVTQRWFLQGPARGDQRKGALAGGALLAPLGALGARRALWADEVVLLAEPGGPLARVHAWALTSDSAGSSLQVWARRVPCWTPLQAGRTRGQVVARSGSA